MNYQVLIYTAGVIGREQFWVCFSPCLQVRVTSDSKLCVVVHVRLFDRFFHVLACWSDLQ